jgi:hypothetical protein
MNMEFRSVNEGKVEAWQTGELVSFLSVYDPKNVFNAGKCGSFFHVTAGQNTCCQRLKLF